MINQSTIQQIQQMAYQLAQAEARHAQQLNTLAQEESRTAAQLQQIADQINQLSWQSMPTQSSYSGYGSSPQWGYTPTTVASSTGYGMASSPGPYISSQSGMASGGSSVSQPGSSLGTSSFFPQAGQYLRSQEAGSMQQYSGTMQV